MVYRELLLNVVLLLGLLSYAQGLEDGDFSCKNKSTEFIDSNSCINSNTKERYRRSAGLTEFLQRFSTYTEFNGRRPLDGKIALISSIRHKDYNTGILMTTLTCATSDSMHQQTQKVYGILFRIKSLRTGRWDDLVGVTSRKKVLWNKSLAWKSKTHLTWQRMRKRIGKFRLNVLGDKCLDQAGTYMCVIYVKGKRKQKWKLSVSLEVPPKSIGCQLPTKPTPVVVKKKEPKRIPLKTLGLNKYIKQLSSPEFNYTNSGIYNINKFMRFTQMKVFDSKGRRVERLSCFTTAHLSIYVRNIDGILFKVKPFRTKQWTNVVGAAAPDAKVFWNTDNNVWNSKETKTEIEIRRQNRVGKLILVIPGDKCDDQAGTYKCEIYITDVDGVRKKYSQQLQISKTKCERKGKAIADWSEKLRKARQQRVEQGRYQNTPNKKTAKQIQALKIKKQKEALRIKKQKEAEKMKKTKQPPKKIVKKKKPKRIPFASQGLSEFFKGLSGPYTRLKGSAARPYAEFYSGNYFFLSNGRIYTKLTCKVSSNLSLRTKHIDGILYRIKSLRTQKWANLMGAKDNKKLYWNNINKAWSSNESIIERNIQNKKGTLGLKIPGLKKCEDQAGTYMCVIYITNTDGAKQAFSQTIPISKKRCLRNKIFPNYQRFQVKKKKPKKKKKAHATRLDRYFQKLNDRIPLKWVHKGKNAHNEIKFSHKRVPLNKFQPKTSNQVMSVRCQVLRPLRMKTKVVEGVLLRLSSYRSKQWANVVGGTKHWINLRGPARPEKEVLWNNYFSTWKTGKNDKVVQYRDGDLELKLSGNKCEDQAGNYSCTVYVTEKRGAMSSYTLTQHISKKDCKAKIPKETSILDFLKIKPVRRPSPRARRPPTRHFRKPPRRPSRRISKRPSYITKKPLHFRRPTGNRLYANAQKRKFRKKKKARPHKATVKKKKSSLKTPLFIAAAIQVVILLVIICVILVWYFVLRKQPDVKDKEIPVDSVQNNPHTGLPHSPGPNELGPQIGLPGAQIPYGNGPQTTLQGTHGQHTGLPVNQGLYGTGPNQPFQTTQPIQINEGHVLPHPQNRPIQLSRKSLLQLAEYQKGVST